jgi:hypothetical protein
MSSQIQQYEAIKAMLAELSDQVSILQSQSGHASFNDYLDRIEGSLKDFGKRQSADIAAVKSAITASQMSDQLGRSSRKDKKRAVLTKVEEVHRALVDAIVPMEGMIEEARPQLRQIIQLIAGSGAAKITEPEQIGSLPETIWSLASTHEQLAPLAMQIKVHLKRQDIQALILQEIEVTDFLEAA